MPPKKLDIFCGTLQEYSDDEQFDAITFINVLDHSVFPWEEIRRVKDLLKPGGILYLRFPNGYLHTHLYQMASKCGLAQRIRKHLVFHQYSFTPKFIRRLLFDAGLSAIIVLNSPASEGDSCNLFLNPTFGQYVKRALYLIAQAFQTISGGKILLGTSLEVVAFKRNHS